MEDAMTIVWDDSKMSTGKASIDEEHKEWIRRFNEFDAAIGQGQGVESVRQLLDFMAEYSETHFVHEEELAGELETPEARLNREEHNKFRKSLSEMRQWIDIYGVSAVEVVSLKLDLEDWLVHHICFVDAKLWVGATLPQH
jgi:hemerythrin